MQKKPTFKYLQGLAQQASNQRGLTLLIEDVVKKAQQYADIRKKDGSAHGDELASLSKRRRFAHDALIDSLNILSRNCQRLGADASWKEEIGENREAIGNWAIEMSKTEKPPGSLI